MSLLFFLGCVKERHFEVNDYEDHLIVFGEITNHKDPVKIKLSRTAPYTNNTEKGRNKPVLKANVWILENDSEKMELVDTSGKGIYELLDGDFKGSPGKTYQLFIETSDGIKYQSNKERMPKPVAIKNIHEKYIEKEIRRSYK